MSTWISKAPEAKAKRKAIRERRVYPWAFLLGLMVLLGTQGPQGLHWPF